MYDTVNDGLMPPAAVAKGRELIAELKALKAMVLG